MSGITPLIDTLLHQVLGRQGEVSLQRSLKAPIQPIPAGEGPRALQRDAHLDGRPMGPPLNDVQRLPPSVDGQRLPTQGSQSPDSSGSTQTHFSPAARSIADVLLRFPAPPSVLRPTVPLMGQQDAPEPAEVTHRLEASIRDSGLFYESHLKRWFQGEMTRQQLLREPQMHLASRPLVTSASGLFPVAPPTISTASANTAIIPNTPLVPVTDDQQIGVRPGIATNPISGTNTSSLVERSDPGQTTAELNGARELADVVATRGRSEIVHESLQSLVRQQLEMLVAPTIRWEGDVWAGIFMALVIHMPYREEGQEALRGADVERGWHSEIQLEVPNVGAFSASLRLYQSILSVDLSTPDLSTYEQLEQGLGALQRRLTAFDFRNVQLKARHIAEESLHDNAG